MIADGSNKRFCIAAASDLLHPDVVSGGAPFRAEVVDRAIGFVTADGMLAF